jgi:serine/threonine protein kinase/cephalosporin-C deacetylase-like acetyl esterase
VVIGETVSHYRILEMLGEGGMGVVYKAEDLQLHRLAALKFLPAQLARDDEARERLIHEARAASALDHPNIGVVYEIGEHDGRYFIAMACYEGATLREKLKDGPLAPDEALAIAEQVAQGLARAHAKGIVHRDIKPANILLPTDGPVRIVDFGLAKLAGATRLTKAGSTLGTAMYMSPEQAQGGDVDQRSDLWSLGAVLYEMLTGRPPFRADFETAIVYAVLNEEPTPVRQLNPLVPQEMEQIIGRALRKKPEARYSSTQEMLQEIHDYQERRRAEALTTFSWRGVLRLLRRPKVLVPTLCLLGVLSALTVWYFNREAKIHWAREEALPEIQRLVDVSWRDYTDAYRLAEQAEAYIPDDPKLHSLLAKSSLFINVRTDPPGANVSMKQYNKPDDPWKFLGVTPIDSVRVPIGIFRWRFTKPGYDTVLAAAATWDIKVTREMPLVRHNLTRTLQRTGQFPAGMVWVPGSETPYGELPGFFIDKHEVTNREYREFVNHEGYRNRQFWKVPFIKNGKSITWDEAMALFVDQTGRPGPATWQAGEYPSGQGDYPVSGVSWYEAAAYAEYAGKSLPTGTHWGLARGEHTPLIMYPQLGGYAVFAPFSNFRGNGPVAVASLPGITSYGAYDMAGNVREWCWNATPEGRLIRGGAWNDNTYMFGAPSQAPPLDRSPQNGFRCVRYTDREKIPAAVFTLTHYPRIRDYGAQRPVPDNVFQAYEGQFAYDKMPLHAHVESRDDTSEEWRIQRITFDAGYDHERMIACLFLPRNAAPPYQTIIYFPGGPARAQKSSTDIEHYFEFTSFVSYIVKSGRAVLFPIYKGTFERRFTSEAPMEHLNSHLFSEFVVHLVQDFERSVDYLDTRKDIDSSKLGYYGISWGGSMGVFVCAVEQRLKASVLLSGGFPPINTAPLPQTDFINYAPHVRIPVLMLNGEYDSIFPLDQTVKPMFDMLGTPAKNKELKVFPTDHIPGKRDFIRETLAWYDRYLGPVSMKAEPSVHNR